MAINSGGIPIIDGGRTEIVHSVGSQIESEIRTLLRLHESGHVKELFPDRAKDSPETSMLRDMFRR